MVFAGAGDVFDGFTEVAPVQFRAPFSGGADQHDGKPRFKSHGDESGLPKTRDAFDANFLCIHRGISLEVVEASRCAPCPGPERSPVLRFAGLTFVDEADDSLSEARAIVGLDRAWIDGGVAPACGEELFSGRGIFERTAKF